ncbi:MAG TPA: lipocalin-like domain-containing protein [Vicinamibacteria bacterium]|nr:lipocalin-like domain-containing protein [Vicinamibacteria bacterium]
MTGERMLRARNVASAALAAVPAVLAVAAALLPSSGRAPARRGSAAPSGPRLELGPGPGSGGFARATEVPRIVLPADHGPHFDYQTEWWYYTGNVAASDGRRFGFQLTFFRRGLAPGPPPGGGLATNQIYFAHLAVTDVAARHHIGVERFARGAGGLAGATPASHPGPGRADGPFAVWLEGWRADGLNADGSAVRLVARDPASSLSLDLELRAAKPLVLHGDRGLSAKSDEPGNASYYVGYTRMAAGGRVGAPGVEADVAGEAWFDHEWSTSALGRGAVGWDWFSLQLDDRRDLMVFRIRREDGGVEAASAGTLVERDGRTRRLSREEVQVEVRRRWTSPDTGTAYPCLWRVAVPAAGLDLVVEARIPDQEMKTSFLYWEGAVVVSGRAGGRAVAGRGYVELTGYARSMQGVF